MKKLLSIVMIIAILFSFCGCEGNLSGYKLEGNIDIPEDGIIEKGIIEQIKDSGSITAFCGESGGYRYEWTLFGTDIEEAKDVNLHVDIAKDPSGRLTVNCANTEPFGFSSMLSIYTGEKWDALTATAYQRTQAMASISITGSEASILNIPLQQGVQNWTIVPQDTPASPSDPANEGISVATDVEIDNGDNYLSAVENGDNTVYTGEISTPTTSAEAGNNTTTDEYTTAIDNTTAGDDYLSSVSGGDGRVYSDGKATGQDKYLTDPVPEGKPMPVEPENQTIDSSKTLSCTFSIECSTILNNLSDLDPDKFEAVPTDGVILATKTVKFSPGESVFDVLQRVCSENGIHMEASWTPIYNSAYVEGIHNLYEFDCGAESGWMYRVNGWYPNYGCSRYQLAAGDVVEWRYTCKGLGKDVGCEWMG